MARLTIKVIPKSRRQEVKKDKNVIKVWLHSPPAEGRANEELVRILADKFGVAKSSIVISSGKSSKIKIVDILGLSDEKLEKSLG